MFTLVKEMSKLGDDGVDDGVSESGTAETSMTGDSEDGDKVRYYVIGTCMYTF
jgi:hypothetical protein